MKKFTFIILMATLINSGAFSQAASSSDTKVIETLYMLPKRGSEEKFEAAMLAHIKKFHESGPYAAGFRRIDYGTRSGWYVLVKGPTDCGTLDKPIGKETGHEQDWSSTVDIYIDQYGSSDLWTYNSEYSYGLDIARKANHYEVWHVDLKPGKYYRFKAIAENLKKVYEKQGNTAFIVLNNTIHTSAKDDLILVWSFDTFAGWLNDPGPRAEYEKMFGDGSWDRMIDEWMDIINDYDAEIRTNIK